MTTQLRERRATINKSIGQSEDSDIYPYLSTWDDPLVEIKLIRTR